MRLKWVFQLVLAWDPIIRLPCMEYGLKSLRWHVMKFFGMSQTYLIGTLFGYDYLRPWNIVESFGNLVDKIKEERKTVKNYKFQEVNQYEINSFEWGNKPSADYAHWKNCSDIVKLDLSEYNGQARDLIILSINSYVSLTITVYDLF